MRWWWLGWCLASASSARFGGAHVGFATVGGSLCLEREKYEGEGRSAEGTESMEGGRRDGRGATEEGLENGEERGSEGGKGKTVEEQGRGI